MNASPAEKSKFPTEGNKFTAEGNRFPAEVRSFLSGQLHDMLDLIYPPVCGLCRNQADSDDRLICNSCWSRIQGLEAPYCSSCREFLWSDLVCSNCDEQSMTVFSLGYFSFDIQTILHDLKYRGLKPLGSILGRRLAEIISQAEQAPAFDLLLAVPLHHSRYHKRGFNQAEEIASGLADGLGVETNFDLLVAARKTRQQARLPASRREANVKNAFSVMDPTGFLKDKAILLVDDVTTTGATLRENRRMLLEAGAKMVMTAVAGSAVTTTS